MFKLGNAPCSWGTIENTSGERSIGYAQMLDELAATGYQGTELGDWGYMPTDPKRLREELESRGLGLIGSWVTVRLYDPAYHRAGIERALKVANLLAEVGGPDCTVNIGDDHSTVPLRSANAGRIKPEHALGEEGWAVYCEGAMRVAEAVKSATGLRSALHHHGATYVETPGELDRFLTCTDSAQLGIVFDTGHYMLGGGDPVEGIETYAERISLVHLKDFQAEVVESAKRNQWTYQQMIGQGLFSELGQGVVPFDDVLAALRRVGYRGWLVVEQDVLPGMGEPKESAARNREFLKRLGL